MNVNYFCGSDHFAMCINIKSLDFTLEGNILQASYISVGN